MMFIDLEVLGILSISAFSGLMFLYIASRELSL
jgi:hypothetical protein